MPLNDSDLAILREAGDHKDHLLFSPSKMKPRSIKALANRLLASGFAAETVTEAGQPSWRESDGKAIGLQLTPAGLAELGGPAQSRDRLDDVQAAAGNDGSRDQPRAHTKIARVMALLQRQEGATLDELIEATGWLPHSTRASLTGLRKRGFDLDRSKRADGNTQYRMGQPSGAQVSDPVIV